MWEGRPSFFVDVSHQQKKIIQRRGISGSNSQQQLRSVNGGEPRHAAARRRAASLSTMNPQAAGGSLGRPGRVRPSRPAWGIVFLGGDLPRAAHGLALLPALLGLLGLLGLLLLLHRVFRQGGHVELNVALPGPAFFARSTGAVVSHPSHHRLELLGLLRLLGLGVPARLARGTLFLGGHDGHDCVVVHRLLYIGGVAVKKNSSC